MSEWTDWYRHEDPRTWVLADILRRRAEEHPDRPYLRFDDGAWQSYGEVDAWANRVANGLIAAGVEPGESVSVMLANCPEFVPVWFGILKAGAVMSPINIAYKGDFLTWPINLVDARHLIVGAEFLDRLNMVIDDLPGLRTITVLPGAEMRAWPGRRIMSFYELVDAPATEPTRTHSWIDDARIMLTSGTTGRSKGVIKQNAADYFSARSMLEVLRAMSDLPLEEHVFFSCLPLFHSNAQVLSVYPALVAGGRIALVERFSASAFWDQLRAAGATVTNTIGAIPYFLWRQPATPRDRDHDVRVMLAAPAPKDVYEQFQERFGVRFVEGYGLTETGVATYMPPNLPPRPGSCGVANPGYEVTIVEPGTDLPLPPDTPGEIVVDQRVPNIIMRAYYGSPEKTAEDFRNLKLHTGDLGRMDADGYVYFMDRVKDYIRRRGENVSSMELERIVAEHPQIAEVAAIGVKAGEGASAEDEILIACVPTEPPPDPAEITGWMAERMPYFMVPRYIRMLTALPKTPTARVRKVALREEGVTAETWDREAAGITLGR